MDSHAPLKKRRVKGTTAPWMNNKIAEAMRDRNHHLRKAQKSNRSFPSSPRPLFQNEGKVRSL